MRNRLTELFKSKNEHILNIYFTAGYPTLDSTETTIHALAKAGVDLIEVGIPYSDPLADGTTIQESSSIALKNGMSLALLFEQISRVRATCDVPIILMGYFNQMLQYGVSKFLENASSVGVDGLIIPDLPMDMYESKYQSLFHEHDISISFLITPQTSDTRISQADKLSTSFIYVVSQSSITGTSGDISNDQIKYFERIQSLELEQPTLIGFGIHNQETYARACAYGQGAIIGSAFIRSLSREANLEKSIPDFIQNIR